MSKSKHPAEALAEMLGDPLPADWRDALAVQARQDHLAALAYAAADAGLELLLHYGRQRRVSPDDPPVDAFLGGILGLDKGWRRYTHDTQRGDAGAIVHDAVQAHAGSLIAAWVEWSLEWVRACEREQFTNTPEQKPDFRSAIVEWQLSDLGLTEPLGALLWTSKAPGATSGSPDVVCALEAVRAAVGDALARGVDPHRMQAAVHDWTSANDGPRINIQIERAS